MPLVLLGPQRLRPTVVDAVRELGIEGPVASVTAGWEERESEQDELAEHLRVPTLNLELYRRSEELLTARPALAAAHRRHRDLLRQLQDLYRLRLHHALSALRRLLRRDEAPELVELEREEAFQAVRDLDRRHLEKVEVLRRELRAELSASGGSALQRHRREILDLLAGCGGVAVAGGHVGILLDRLLLFDLGEALGALPVVAWSAGAMALGERVVLFHDSPPQGAGNAEVMARGVGLFRGLLPLPHARRRLKLQDRRRASLLARRFEPLVCVPLDEGEGLEIDGGGPIPRPGARRVERDGEVRPWPEDPE